MEPNRNLTVHWKEHSELLSKGLWNLFKEEHIVDANVSFGGDKIKVHRLLLSVFLPFFTKMSTGNTVNELNLDYVADEKRDIQSLVEFLYTGKTTIAEDRIQYVHNLARDLDFKGFVRSIEKCDRDAMITSGREGFLCTSADDDEDESSFEESDNAPTVIVEPLQKNTETFPQDIANVECRVILKRVDTSKPNGAITIHKKIKPNKKTIKRTHECDTSDLTGVYMSGTRCLSAALKRNKESTDDDLNKKQSNSFAKETKRAKASEEEGGGGAEKAEDSDVDIASENGKTFKQREYMRTDSSTLTATMRCGHCEYQSESNSEFKRHMKQHELNNLKCKKCNYEFTSEHYLRLHINTCGKDLPFECSHCGKHVQNFVSLEQHLAEKHGVDIKGNPLEENVKCTQCDFVCLIQHQLKLHILNKHTERKFECPHCEYACVKKAQLNRHVSLTHLKERKYSCNACGASYQTRSTLNNHIKVKHHGIRPFKCNECNKDYACREAYNNHVLTHSGNQKPFACDVCEYRTNKRYNLGAHMKKKHGLQMESLKKVYAPRQSATNEVESVSDDVEMKETAATIGKGDDQLHEPDGIFP